MELSKEEFIEILDARFKANKQETAELIDARFKANKQETAELIDARFKANNAELKEAMVQIAADQGRLNVDQMRSEMRATEKRIIQAVSEVVGDGVIPQIEEHEVRITKLEEKAALA